MGAKTKIWKTRVHFLLSVMVIGLVGFTQSALSTQLPEGFSAYDQMLSEQDSYWTTNVPFNFDLTGLDCSKKVLNQLYISPEKSEFADDAIKSTRYFMSGLCYFNADLSEDALVAFKVSINHFKKLLEGVNTRIESKKLSIDKNNNALQTLSFVRSLERLVTSTTGSYGGGSHQMLDGILSMQERMLKNDLKNIQASIDSNIKVSELTSSIRIPVVPTTGFLRYIVRVNSENNNGASSCTGSFVGPNIVLTNFHCLGDKMSVIRDSLAIKEKFNVVKRHTAFGSSATPANVKFSEYSKDDWALLEIDGIRSDRNNYLLVAPSSPTTVNSTILAGYSSDVSAGNYLTADVGCSMSKDDVRNRLISKCSAFKGSSGAPVLSVTDQRMIIALHNAGDNSQGTSASSRLNTFSVVTERFSNLVYQLVQNSKPTTEMLQQSARQSLQGLKSEVEMKKLKLKNFKDGWD